MTSHRRHNAIGARLPLLLALAGPVSAYDAPPAAHHLDAVVVEGHYDNAVGTQRLRDDGVLRFNAYAIRSELDRWSTFSYLLENPVDLNPAGIAGDQFRQSERRTVFGMTTSRSWDSSPGGLPMTTTLGLQLRHDRLDPVWPRNFRLTLIVGFCRSDPWSR
jgi:hypothetical protein